MCSNRAGRLAGTTERWPELIKGVRGSATKSWKEGCHIESSALGIRKGVEKGEGDRRRRVKKGGGHMTNYK